jgi:hypothetical protein
VFWIIWVWVGDDSGTAPGARSYGEGWEEIPESVTWPSDTSRARISVALRRAATTDPQQGAMTLASSGVRVARALIAWTDTAGVIPEPPPTPDPDNLKRYLGQPGRAILTTMGPR